MKTKIITQCKLIVLALLGAVGWAQLLHATMTKPTDVKAAIQTLLTDPKTTNAGNSAAEFMDFLKAVEQLFGKIDADKFGAAIDLQNAGGADIAAAEKYVKDAETGAARAEKEYKDIITSKPTTKKSIDKFLKRAKDKNGLKKANDAVTAITVLQVYKDSQPPGGKGDGSTKIEQLYVDANAFLVRAQQAIQNIENYKSTTLAITADAKALAQARTDASGELKKIIDFEAEALKQKKIVDDELGKNNEPDATTAEAATKKAAQDALNTYNAASTIASIKDYVTGGAKADADPAGVIKIMKDADDSQKRAATHATQATNALSAHATLATAFAADEKTAKDAKSAVDTYVKQIRAYNDAIDLTSTTLVEKDITDAITKANAALGEIDKEIAKITPFITTYATDATKKKTFTDLETDAKNAKATATKDYVDDGLTKKLNDFKKAAAVAADLTKDKTEATKQVTAAKKLYEKVKGFNDGIDTTVVKKKGDVTEAIKDAEDEIKNFAALLTAIDPLIIKYVSDATNKKYFEDEQTKIEQYRTNAEEQLKQLKDKLSIITGAKKDIKTDENTAAERLLLAQSAKKDAQKLLDAINENAKKKAEELKKANNNIKTIRDTYKKAVIKAQQEIDALTNQTTAVTTASTDVGDIIVDIEDIAKQAEAKRDTLQGKITTAKTTSDKAIQDINDAKDTATQKLADAKAATTVAAAQQASQDAQDAVANVSTLLNDVVAKQKKATENIATEALNAAKNAAEYVTELEEAVARAQKAAADAVGFATNAQSAITGLAAATDATIQGMVDGATQAYDKAMLEHNKFTTAITGLSVKYSTIQEITKARNAVNMAVNEARAAKEAAEQKKTALAAAAAGPGGGAGGTTPVLTKAVIDAIKGLKTAKGLNYFDIKGLEASAGKDVDSIAASSIFSAALNKAIKDGYSASTASTKKAVDGTLSQALEQKLTSAGADNVVKEKIVSLFKLNIGMFDKTKDQ